MTAVITALAKADALGWQTEFLRSREAVRRRFGVPFVEHFYSWTRTVGGRFHGYIDHVHPGDYSDDTQMTLMVARAIGEDGRFDPEYFASVELPLFRLYVRGGGATVKAAAQKIQRKSARWYSNFFTYAGRGSARLDYRDSGANGVAMRVAPHALANLHDPERGETDVWFDAIITHGHPRAIVGGLAHYWALVLAAKSPDAHALLSQLRARIRGIAPPSVPPLGEWLRKWESDGRRFRPELEAAKEEILRFLDLAEQALAREGDQEFLKAVGALLGATRGSGTVSASAALYYFLKYRSEPERGLLRSVNQLGTDTDTIASMAASLFGMEGRPVFAELEVQDASYLAQADATGRLPRLPASAVQPAQLKPPVETWAEGQRIRHPCFGEGTVLERWDDVTRTGGRVSVARVVWDFGQSMVLHARG